MDKEKKDLQMEIYIKDSIKTIDSMDLVPITGNKVTPHMREVSKMDSGMEKENGHLDKPNIQVPMHRD